MAIPRRLFSLPAAAAAVTTSRSIATLSVAHVGIGARPSTAVLAAAATAAAAAGRASECQSLLLRMSRRRGASRHDIVSSLLASSPAPQPQVFDLLIRTYTQSRKPREAFEAFRLLLGHRVPVPAAASNALLAALSRAGWPHLTADAYRLVLSSGSEVNSYTLNIMVHSYCKSLQFDKAETVISEMETRCVFPDVVTHNVMVDARFRAGDVEAAMAVVDSMASKGIKPGILTYNAVLKGLCRNGRWDKAREVFRAMDACGVAPDVRSFNMLIWGFCRVGEVEEAMQFYKEMRRRGVRPDVVSFSCLIGLFARRGKMWTVLLST